EVTRLAGARRDRASAVLSCVQGRCREALAPHARIYRESGCAFAGVDARTIARQAVLNYDDRSGHGWGARPRGGVESDRRVIRDIERGEASRGGHAGQHVAVLARLTAQPLAFGAEHQRHGTAEVRAVDRGFAIAVEANAAHTKL